MDSAPLAKAAQSLFCRGSHARPATPPFCTSCTSCQRNRAECRCILRIGEGPQTGHGRTPKQGRRSRTIPPGPPSMGRPRHAFIHRRFHHVLPISRKQNSSRCLQQWPSHVQHAHRPLDAFSAGIVRKRDPFQSRRVANFSAGSPSSSDQTAPVPCLTHLSRTMATESCSGPDINLPRLPTRGVV